MNKVSPDDRRSERWAGIRHTSGRSLRGGCSPVNSAAAPSTAASIEAPGSMAIVPPGQDALWTPTVAGRTSRNPVINAAIPSTQAPKTESNAERSHALLLYAMPSSTSASPEGSSRAAEPRTADLGDLSPRNESTVEQNFAT